jgi:hypothetical protein
LATAFQVAQGAYFPSAFSSFAAFAFVLFCSPGLLICSAGSAAVEAMDALPKDEASRILVDLLSEGRRSERDHQNRHDYA